MNDLDMTVSGYEEYANVTLLNPQGWLPIGVARNDNSFTGHFIGMGYTITGLRINRPDTNNVGLFGHVGQDNGPTVIKNLGLRDVEVKGARGTGTLIGRVTGHVQTIVEYCYADGGNVTGDAATGNIKKSLKREQLSGDILLYPIHRPFALLSFPFPLPGCKPCYVVCHLPQGGACEIGEMHCPCFRCPGCDITMVAMV